MITRFHGIDKHKKYPTISVLNRKEKEIDFKERCYDLKEYIENLGSEDAVVIESSTGAFYWADRIESKGALCYVIDPHKFRIIKDSWKKTDKHDSRNTAKALWVYIVTGEFGMWVFLGKNNKPLYPDTWITKHFRKILKENNVPPMRFHDLRHTFVSILIGEGIPTADVQKFARHASYETATDIYRHLLPDQLEKGLNRLDVLLQSIEETIEKRRSVNSH